MTFLTDPVATCQLQEHLAIEPARRAVVDILDRSLVAQLGWGALLSLIYFAIKRDGKSALLVGALIPTHWALDFIAHRPDMPIYPGGNKFGLGMWQSIPLTISVEYVLFAAGIALYLSAT